MRTILAASKQIAGSIWHLVASPQWSLLVLSTLLCMAANSWLWGHCRRQVQECGAAAL